MARYTLCQKLLDSKKFWENKNVLLPAFDRKEIPIKSICFSAGRMAFGHTGDILQDILNKDQSAGTMVGIETHAARYVVELAASDYLMTQLIFDQKKGVVMPKIQSALPSVLFVDNTKSSMTWNKFMEYARDPQLQYGTINAPEGAYGISYSGGEFADPISEVLKKDLIEGTSNSDAAKWASFLLERYKAGLKFSLVSCTNFSGNGHVTGATLRTVGKHWEEKGFAPKGFLDYLRDPKQCAFPNTMIDRIAVSPDEQSQKVLDTLEINSNIVVTEKTRYWIVEDLFPAGRPNFELAEGVIVEESYEEVKKYEDMKLRILNMAHSTIAGLGVLLGYRGKYGIYNAMQDGDIRALIGKIIDVVIETIDHPRKMNPQDFATATFERLDNPNIPDDPMRIALNGSTKMLPRFLDTFNEGRERHIDPSRLELVLLPVAGFLRYTLGIDDKGEKFNLEDDPQKDLLVSCGKKAKIGDSASASIFAEIIAKKEIMGKNLYADGDTGRKLQDMVGAMLSRDGAVRSTVIHYLSK